MPGNGWFRIGSIDASFGLGKGRDGQTAGDIFLRAEMAAPANSTPQALSLSTLGEAQAVYDGVTLRQVVAPEVFVNIATIDEYAYEIRFYQADAKGDLANGVYQLLSGAIPYVTWHVENPDRSAVAYNRLRITEIRGTSETWREYSWAESENTWSLAESNRTVIQSEVPAPDGRVVREIVTDSGGSPSSDIQTTYRQIMAGGTTREVVVEQVADPDGDALTTITSYYEDPCHGGVCGRLRRVTSPDGSWVEYSYDSWGRIASEYRGDRHMTFSYTPDGAGAGMPRVVAEWAGPRELTRTYYVYQSDQNGRRDIVERCGRPGATYGDPNNERTTTEYYPAGTGDADAGLIRSVTYPDGRLDSYTYEYGSYTAGIPGTFTPGSGAHVCETVVHGTTAYPDGIAGKTTREKTVKDAVGNVLLQEIYVYTGNGEERIGWTVNTLDSLGRVLETNRSDGTRTESAWACCGKETETDALGITTSSTYDDLKRVDTETRPGPLGEILTAYTYDASGRVLTKTTVAGGLGTGTTNTYDLAGRLTSTTDSAGLTTTYGYAAGGRTTTVTKPGGATEITERYLDGRVKSVTGTGVVARYYKYGVNPDGTQWTRVTTGSPLSARWEETTTDALGRTIRVERPAFGGGTEVSESFYDAGGRLVRTTAPGQSDTLYEYDEVGNLFRTGLDVDGNGSLDPVSEDRIQETETAYVRLGGAWWQETAQRVYAVAFDGTPTTAAVQRSRLTGLGGGLVGEAVAIDVNGNPTVTQVLRDRATSTEQRITDYPDTTIDQVETSVEGLLVSSQSKTGVTTTFQYDPLGRRTGVTDPRTGTTITAYNALGQVAAVTDPAFNTTTYTYEPETGRLATETNAKGYVTRYAYDDRGQVTHVWGDADYPVKYVYDDLGRKTEMHTYRDESVEWNTASFPASPGVADVTRWHYDEGTGLLEAKEDASGKQASYTYISGGKLETRTWARLDQGQPLITAYVYDPATADLTVIDYSDATSDVAFTHDRLGRHETVTDAAGTRTFAYDPGTLALTSETLTGLVEAVLTRTYETTGVPGRLDGFHLGPDHEVSSGYEPDTGRLASVWWSINATPDSASYTYVAQSDRLETRLLDGNVVTTYAYEPYRNLTTRLRHEVGTNRVAQHDYEYNELGQRTAITQSGRAFAEALTAKLLGQAWFANAVNTGNGIELVPEYRDYSYDPIGNRTEAATKDPNTGSLLPTGYTANLLNQYDEIAPATGTPQALSYDDDGNLVSFAAGLTTLYAYDAENRLIRVEPESPANGDTKVELAYDYMGRRIRKTTSTYQGGTWSVASDRTFLYDGWNLVEEREAGGPVVKAYVWGLDLSSTLQGAGGIGGLLAGIEGSTVHYVLPDANGNVGQLVDAATGSVAAHYEYDPFGNLTYSSGPAAGGNPFRFSTKYHDDETGLVYYGYRYYSPELGRWLNRDPIEEEGGLNLYGFVGNNPISFIDALGQCKIEVRFAILGNISGKSWYHAYLVTTDPKGGKTYFRGGPSAGGPSGGSPGQISSGAGGSASVNSGSNSSGSNNSGNSSSPGSGPGGQSQRNGPWGPIVTQSGPYVPGTIDWDPGNPPSTTVLNNSDPCDCYDQSLSRAIQDINNARIPYNPFSTNSNAVVREALERAGFNPSNPPVWAPGWGTQLP